MAMQADSEKKLRVLSSLSNTSELSGHKAEETKWLQQQMDQLYLVALALPFKLPSGKNT
jgi:hypothetical protein